MTKKISGFEENRQTAEQKITDKLAMARDTEQDKKSLLRLGAVGAIGRLAQALNAQTIRALQSVRDEKDFEALGFTRFDVFMDESEISPMSYRQFYDREKLLLQEGDQLFDLLNSLQLSRRHRRLLGSGQIEVDDQNGTVIIKATVGNGDAVATKTEEIELTDRNRLLQTLSALADQNFLLNDKTNKQKVKIERGEKDIEELKKKLDEAKNRPGELSAESLHFEAYMRASNAIYALAETVKNLPTEQTSQHGPVYLRSLDVAMAHLQKAYKKPLGEMNEKEIENEVARRLKKTSGKFPEDNEFAEVTSSTSDEELAEMM